MSLTGYSSVLLNELQRRTFCIRVWRGLQFGLGLTLCAQIPIFFLAPLRDVLGLDLTPTLNLLFATATLTVGFLAAFLVPLAPNFTARLLDKRYSLKERIQTALEASDNKEFGKLLLQDAIRCLREDSEEPKVLTFGKLRWRSTMLSWLIGTALLLWPPVSATLFQLQSPSGPAATASNTIRADKESVSSIERESELHAAAKARLLETTLDFKDSTLASPPPDFVSFVRSGGDQLDFLRSSRDDRSGHTDGPSLKLGLNSNSAGSDASFESAGPSANEVDERVANMENATTNLPSSASRSGAAKQSSATNNNGSNISPKSSETESSKAPSDGKGRNDSLKKGLTKEAATSAEHSSGTPSSNRVEIPSPATNKHSSDTDAQSARFGGGQYPHNAPGAGFPDWMRGNEDPHFMDAGQGEGRSTGKTSGQAGMGHALLRKSPGAEKKSVAETRDVFVPGRIGDKGEQLSYDIDALAPPSGASPAASYSKVPGNYSSAAEERMSNNHVPADYRDLVRGYFSEIKKN